MANKPTTNGDIIAEVRSMRDLVTNLDGRLHSIEVWKISEDAARKAISEYKSLERGRLRDSETSEWIKVAKQVGLVLGIVIALLYAYAATKGIIR